MIARLACILAATAWLAAAAAAQEQQKPQAGEVVVVPSLKKLIFHHYDCPPPDPAVEGGSPERPMDLEFFDRAWANAAYSDEPDDPGDEPNRFECRWIRLSGFMQWDAILYQGQLYETPLASYQRGNVFYFIENFATGSPPRGDLARRRLTLVARFYDLCAAGQRALAPERAAGGLWDLSYPCHEVPAMMLADVRVEKVHDARPQYLLGEANRAVMESLRTASDADRIAVEPTLRAWAASLRKGVKSFAAEYVAKQASWAEENRLEVLARIESADSYESHLLRQRAFVNLDLQTAQTAVFRRADDDAEFDRAMGCVCLETSCTDRWPLTWEDAATFLGDAACVELWHPWKDPAWRW